MPPEHQEPTPWDIRRAGRAWTGAEFRQRADLRPEKLEIWEGKLLFSEEDRIKLLGLLLENLGADQAVRMGDPNIWISAVEPLKPSVPRRTFLKDPFNRWMLTLYSLTLLVTVGALFLSRRPDLPHLSATGESMLLCAVVALWTSLGVHAFLK